VRRAINRGYSLLELLVALAIGSFLILGSFRLLAHVRSLYTVNEAVARLQENARFALDALESDLRLSGYLGPATAGSATDEASLAPALEPTGLSIANDCGDGWALSLHQRLDASNNRYGLDCAPYRNRPPSGSDTIVIRRAGSAPVTSRTAGTLYVATAPFRRPIAFAGTILPASVTAEPRQVHPVVVNAYYVSPTSTLSGGDVEIPSLRMKTLQGGASGPRIVDQEVLPGVEDLQVMLGVDTDAPGTEGHGIVSRYVHPDDPVLDPSNAMASDVRIVAVRVWIRVRSEHPEPGYQDTSRYRYADTDLPPPNDGHRRLAVSRTVALRNPVRP
jgi:type IV pilus assembly protein PilW